MKGKRRITGTDASVSISKTRGKWNKRTIGAEYEKKAGAYLASMGYHILEYNFRNRQGEIDIVARDGPYLVFVEVKYRASGRNGHPVEAVDFRKQRGICRTARYYLMTKGFSMDTPCRFDVVAAEGQGISVIKDAFPYIE